MGIPCLVIFFVQVVNIKCFDKNIEITSKAEKGSLGTLKHGM